MNFNKIKSEIVSLLYPIYVKIPSCPSCGKTEDVHRTDNLFYDKILKPNSPLRNRLPDQLLFFTCLNCEKTFD